MGRSCVLAHDLPVNLLWIAGACLFVVDVIVIYTLLCLLSFLRTFMQQAVYHGAHDSLRFVWAQEQQC